MKLPFRKKKRRKKMSPLKAGAIGVVLLAIFLYLGFTKFALPISSQFTIHAIVPNAGGLRPDSFVRIAGVDVGKVTTVTPVEGKQAANVTMQIQSNGLPIHSDATFWIRPRLFVEGNFFVDLYPGSPSAPDVKSGHTFPIQQTRYPVQLDQLFDSLQANTRQNLQTLLTSYGSAVKKAGPSFKSSIKYWLPAYEYTSIVTHDLLGEQPNDLSNYIAKQAVVSGAFDAHPQNLKNLITDFNTTANAFARENAALQQTVAQLPRTLRIAMPAFNALNAAFPPLRALARALLPGVRSTGPTIDASLPFIHQLRLLVQPSELQGLAIDLSHTIPSLARLTQETIPLMRKGVRPASSCAVNVLLPWSRLEIHDRHFNAHNGFPPHHAYLEVVDFLPGLAGESRVFDANGPYIRLLGNGGTLTYSLQPGLFGSALSPIIGVQPVPPPHDRRPPLKEHVPCETQPRIKTLNDSGQGAPPPKVSTASTPATQALSKSISTVFNYELDRILQQEGSNMRVAGTHLSGNQQSVSQSPAKQSNPSRSSTTSTQTSTTSTGSGGR